MKLDFKCESCKDFFFIPKKRTLLVLYTLISVIYTSYIFATFIYEKLSKFFQTLGSF